MWYIVNEGKVCAGWMRNLLRLMSGWGKTGSAGLTTVLLTSAKIADFPKNCLQNKIAQ
jgi:hypothetical protein